MAKTISAIIQAKSPACLFCPSLRPFAGFCKYSKAGSHVATPFWDPRTAFLHENGPWYKQVWFKERDKSQSGSRPSRFASSFLGHRKDGKEEEFLIDWAVIFLNWKTTGWQDPHIRLPQVWRACWGKGRQTHACRTDFILSWKELRFRFVLTNIPAEPPHINLICTL